MRSVQLASNKSALGNTWAFRDTTEQAGIKGPLQYVVAMHVCLFLIVCAGDVKRERQR